MARRDRFAPTIEGLETRRLLSFAYPFSAYSPSSYSTQQLAARTAIVRHEYDRYVGELKRLERKSQATPAEYLALRDDARAISAAASSATLSPAIARNKAVEVTLQLDRSPLNGWLGDSGWSEVSARLTSNLDSLGIPRPLDDRTIADMDLAASAGVSSAEFQTFTRDFNSLRDGESSLRSSTYSYSYDHFDDPGLYYTQHLRGFFRGWGVQRVDAESKLRSDLRTVQAEGSTDPSGMAVVRRDVRLLERLGAALPSTTNQQLLDTYLAAFVPGEPIPPSPSQLRSNLATILGATGNAARLASVDQLVNDATAFDRAVGSSAARVRTIVDDVKAVVDAGGDEPLNPFKVTVSPGP